MAVKGGSWVVALALVVIGCSPQRLFVRQMTDLVDTGITAFERDNDLDLMEKAMPAHIKLLEALLANSPDDIQLITLLSRLYGSYTFGFVETRLEERHYLAPASGSGAEERDSLRDQVSRYYEKGAGYALMALEKRQPGATDAFRKINTIEPFLDRLGKQAVAPLFWYGFNLGAWINHNLDSIRAVSRAHLAREVMERVIELEPAYNHGGAHLFLMAYYGSRPPMLGGNQAKALDHYALLKQIAGDGYLLSDLFFARFCLQQQRDREGFVDLMQRIAAHPAGDSEVAMYNAIAGRRAAIYLSAVGALFE